MKKSFLIILVLFIFFSCTYQERTAQEMDLKKVSFATSKNMWCGLGLIAYEKGFFKDEGLDVKITFLEAGRYCLDALVSNSVDFATIVEVNTAYFGYTGNISIVNIASIVSSTSSGIIANRNSGIEKPKDIEGKTLALSPGTTSDIFANRFIEKHGISPDQVDVRKIQPLAIQSAMISGEIDAASTWDPHIYNIAKILGENAIVFRDPEIYTGYMLVAVRKDWANENQETVRAFLQALEKAEQFAKSNISEAQQIVAKSINLNVDVIQATWKDHSMVLKLDKNELLNAIRSESEWFQENIAEYKYKKVPDYNIYIEDKYIMEVIPK